MANRNFPSQKSYSMHAMPVAIDAYFTVDAANTNGLGISSMNGPGIQAIYMHSSAATPSSVNPAAGTIVVRLQDNYNKLLSANHMIMQSPGSGSDVKIDNSALTAGVAYVISILGNATAAKWHAIGVPPGVTPAVGVSFIALSNGGTGNTLTSRVQASAAAGAGICSVEIVGNSNLAVDPSPSANQGYGAEIILQCRDYAGAIAQPADNSVISLSFLLNNSGVVTGANGST